MKFVVVALALALMGATLPAQDSAAALPAPAASGDEYALREAQARGLEEFEGGFHGVFIFALIVFVAVTVTLCLWVDARYYCGECRVYLRHPHHHPRPLPPPNPVEP